ncbi:hypothetical protein HUT06_29445 [Actinomadura sp. NAK00032]|uniref:hypothetical protein n=1 Tax=Actinomadura sp. NAK00032 TaxID=2742128 RepID=UPI0015918FA8|nr:hypothetical protein [Actinomadura sp. NAK00032]QKW37627.1 hypothetical protein HUT06_29445 [Actinomadura sp. NAK00032]
MGVDWYRMRPRRDADAFGAAVRAQRAAFAASGSWFPDEFGHLDMPEPADGPDITGLVDVDTGAGNSHRVNALVLTPLLPAEWRFAMYRSFPPDELASHLRRWRTHVEEVRDGGHRPYLRAWHAYSTGRRLTDEWASLRQRALNAVSRTNAWAVRPELVDVRERILSRPVPTVSPAPRWGAACAARHIDAAPYAGLAREWNRRVPANQKVHVTQPPSFSEFLDDDSPDETLRWMEEAAEEGYGLLLDW